MHDAESGAAVSDWVRRFTDLIPADGVVLDVAAGGGRHSRYFRARGNRVVAVDRMLDGLSALTGDPCVELVEADIENGPWPFPGRCFAGVLVTNYLHRPLMPVLAASVAPGGALIYETFAVGQAAFGRPANPDFLLKPLELLETFRSTLSVVAYETGIVERPRRAAIQRLAAVARSELVLLDSGPGR